MSAEGRAYVVRNADAGSRSGEVTQVYAYTLQGLTTALEDARHRSHDGTPKEVAVMTGGKSRIIRRYQDGHEEPLAP